MTCRQFQDDALHLVQAALLAGRCPSCAALDLLAIIGAVQQLFGLSAEDLLSHRQHFGPLADLRQIDLGVDWSQFSADVDWQRPKPPLCGPLRPAVADWLARVVDTARVCL